MFRDSLFQGRASTPREHLTFAAKPKIGVRSQESGARRKEEEGRRKEPEEVFLQI
ncbi:hypothetical protein [Microcoleus vaginatus]|uniref:hypothetical protein n=1 Tax=Microcoleus vaginatus TaxID=119532 RepID=UPI001F605DDB